jgi:hypothetical protein
VQERRDASNRRHLHAHLATLPDWQHEPCHDLRELIHAAVPQIEETIKHRVRRHFILDGNICALLAGKDHINLFHGAIGPDPHHIITGDHHNKPARMISLWRNSTIPREPLATMLQHIAANNRADGGERSNTHRKPRPKYGLAAAVPHEAPQTAHSLGGNASAQGIPDLQRQKLRAGEFRI